MAILARLRSWLRATVQRRSHRREIDEELRLHLEHEIDALVDAGVPRRAAARQARARFGSLDALREECREARGTRVVDATVQDLRYGVRMLLRHPGFATTAIVTLALTVGAVSTTLTLVSAFDYSRWPVRRPEQIVEVQATRDQGTATGLVSWADYLHFRDRVRGLEQLAAAYTVAPLHVTSGQETLDVNGAAISANLLPMLGLEPALGRFFRPEEDAVPDRDRVAVLGHEFWRRRYGADPGILGASLEINGTTFTVIGVAPAAFTGFDAQPVSIYLPTMMLGVAYRWCSVLEDPDCTILEMFGRRAENVSTTEVRAEVQASLPERWRRAEPGGNSGADVREVRGLNQSAADRSFLRLLIPVAAVLFLVCCANLAGLLIARGRSRDAELALRASLGASAGRLVRQLATEAVLTATAGGALGLVASVTFTRLLQARFYALDSSGRPLAYDLTLRPGIVFSTLALAVLAGLLFGLLPARGLVRRNLASVGASAPGRVSAQPHRWLLAVQAASAVALVALAALLAASAGARGQDGLDPDQVALLRLRPRLAGYGPEQATRLLHETVERLEALPGVESVSMVGTGIALLGFAADVAPEEGSTAAARVGYIEVGPRYFETLGTPVLRGREFSAADDGASAPVAIVSAALGRRLWPDRDPIGTTVLVNGQQRSVVGVVADVEMQARGEPPRPYIFVPFWQNPGQIDARLQVRVGGDPAAMIPTIVAAIRDLDPRLPVTETITLNWRLAGMFRPLWMSATAVTYAGLLAVVLAALGLYASLAAAVTQRTKEIGIRQALGATSAGILAMVTREGLRVILVGVLCGGGIAWTGARLLRHMLHGPASGDVTAYVFAAVLVVGVGVAACLIPARRAARIEPMQALRAD